MNRLAYLIIGTIFLIVTSCNSSINNDLQRLNLKGKVKKITNVNFIAVEKFGEISKGEMTPYSKQSDDITFFNINGFLIEETAMSNPKYKYDNNNKLIEIIKNSHFISQMMDTIIFKYNNKNLKVQEDVYSSKLLTRKKYTYDESGNEIENRLYDGDGKLLYLTKKKYLNHKLIEERIFNSGSDNDLQSLKKYKYDLRGNQIEEIIYNDTNSIDKLQRTTQKFDDNDNLIEYIYYSNLVSQFYGEEYFSTKNVYTKYDASGNWIECIQYLEEKPHLVIIRKIEYYN